MPHRRKPRSRSARDWSQVPNAVTALTAVGALVFTGLSLTASREQLDLARTEQITERFTRAVEHLGNDDTMDIRLGAVFALERIARDSAADRDAVGQLLAAFVRRRRPLDGSCAPGIGRDHADVEAALRVVSTQELTSTPDLAATCLSGVDLHRARLRCAVLTGAALHGTTLTGADLHRADLSGAALTGVDPADPDSTGANLDRADLEGAVLTFADLGRAYLVGADLRGADLGGATLTRASLRGADLRGAHLERADLTDADLSGAKLAGAYVGDTVFGSAAARAAALAGGAVDGSAEVPVRACGA